MEGASAPKLADGKPHERKYYTLIIIFLLNIMVNITKLSEWASILVDKCLSVIEKRITMVIRVTNDDNMIDVSIVFFHVELFDEFEFF